MDSFNELKHYYAFKDSENAKRSGYGGGGGNGCGCSTLIFMVGVLFLLFLIISEIW